MALDQSFVGRTYPPTAPYEVGREKIREFAEAINDPNPAYRDREAADCAPGRPGWRATQRWRRRSHCWSRPTPAARRT
jgi:acyl dehydratase